MLSGAERVALDGALGEAALLFGGTPFPFGATGPAGGYTLDSLTADRGVAGTYLWDTMLRLDLQRRLGLVA